MAINKTSTNDNTLFKTTEQFVGAIAAIMEKTDEDIIQSIVLFCDAQHLDINDILPLIDANIKQRILDCAIGNRYVFKKNIKEHLPNSRRLPMISDVHEGASNGDY